MERELTLTWTRLLNGVGSLLVGVLVVFLVVFFTPVRNFGPLGAVALLVLGAALVGGLYAFFERL